MSRNDDLRKLDELLDAEDGPTEWELNFLESLNKQRDQDFTMRQREKLESIFERVCNR